MKNSHVNIHPEVQEAISKNKPVVALESTIISHGMPWPGNVETALLLEETVRANGAVPATIAIIEGVFRIGLDKKEVEFMGSEKNIRKASRADIPGVLAKGENAAVTVSGTMIGAHIAGIRIFATGGIGGVHRGAEKNFDISADLPELSKTPVAVVSAGAKAILDLPLTLEYLETLGVPVVGFKTSELPAFYYRKSGLMLNESVSSANEAARLMFMQWQLPDSGGILIANPIPEEDALDSQIINSAIESALKLADEKKIKGKALTPFLLKELEKITTGKSQKANIALVKNNAAVAAQIAVEYSNLQK
ncbi:MAG: pseudouridine-5'-phosphate glycosidase [Candidatus Riflebacteria bacterium]|nr:pseudouridine-5'-phosphate glycosidase [Candidatus Riflebacteria bacterium]